MSISLTVPEARSRWKFTTIITIVALVLSMLSLTAGQQSLARAEDGASRTISGVVTLPEGSAASFADVSVQATLDGAAEAGEAVEVAEDGSYAIADLEPGAYRVEFVVAGDSADAVDGQVYGATAETPEGELVDVTADSRVDVDVALAAVIVVEEPGSVTEQGSVAEQEAADAQEQTEGANGEAELGADEPQERVRPRLELVTPADLNTDPNSPVQFGTVPDDSSAPAAAPSLQAPQAIEAQAQAALTGTRTISGKVSVAAGAALSKARVYLINAEETVGGVRAGSDSRYLKLSTSTPIAERDAWNATTGAYTFKNLAPGRYRGCCLNVLGFGVPVGR